VERSDRVGGLIKTEDLDGFLFDPTGHWLHLRDPEVKALVHERWLKDRLVTLQRRAAIYSRGVFTRFPYQVNTHGLPPEVVAENLVGFVEAVYGEKGRALREREPRTFEEFILRYLGEGFARNFMVPYNQKLWGVHPSRLLAAWCGRFVPRPTLKEVVDGALGLGADSIGYNATFVYPKEGGIESWARAIRASLQGGEVLTRTEPLRVDWRNKRVALSDGQAVAYSSLLSTISLPGLVKLLWDVPDEVVAAAGKLRATTVTYVAVGARGPNRQPWHWIYLPEPEFASYRIGSPSAAYPALAPEGCCSFYVEYSHQGQLAGADAERHAVEDLLRSQMIHRREDVLFARAREIPHAYVLYDEDYSAAKQAVVSFLERAGIDVAGRYGSWEYGGMEDALISGRAFARKVNASPPP